MGSDGAGDRVDENKDRLRNGSGVSTAHHPRHSKQAPPWILGRGRADAMSSTREVAGYCRICRPSLGQARRVHVHTRAPMVRSVSIGKEHSAHNVVTTHTGNHKEEYQITEAASDRGAASHVSVYHDPEASSWRGQTPDCWGAGRRCLSTVCFSRDRLRLETHLFRRFPDHARCQHQLVHLGTSSLAAYREVK